MKKLFALCGLFSALALASAGCGGNVVVTGGGGNGGGGGNSGGKSGSGPSVDACQDYANKVIEKYTECGIDIMQGSPSGMIDCSPQIAAQATCLASCLPKIDCACIKDPTGSGCNDKLKPYADCVTACIK